MLAILAGEAHSTKGGLGQGYRDMQILGVVRMITSKLCQNLVVAILLDLTPKLISNPLVMRMGFIS